MTLRWFLDSVLHVRKYRLVHVQRVPLIIAPTPLHKLLRLSETLGVDLWIKRDDLTGFALGGNKGRKLEYLMGEAISQGAEVVVTCGSLQSNFIRQLAAACSVLGLKCAAATMSKPYEFSRPEGGLDNSGGNVLLNQILGADIRNFPDGSWERLYQKAEELALEYEADGAKVFRIPIGGSSPEGAYAFYLAASELKEDFDWILFASSSGSTHAGLQYAFQGTATRVLGIACDPEPDIVDDFIELYSGLEAIAGSKPTSREEWNLSFDYVGEGYGVPSPEGTGAIQRMAREEGIFLDPIYTAKAFAGLLDLVRKRTIDGRILFWHTGGVPALFADGNLVASLQGESETND